MVYAIVPHGPSIGSDTIHAGGVAAIVCGDQPPFRRGYHPKRHYDS